MEKIITELKTILRFKETTAKGDIVLVVAEKPSILAYALVMDIVRDMSKRDEWWHVTLQFLTIPPQRVVWILREPQFTGREIFTMGGEKRFIKAVDFFGPPLKEEGGAPPSSDFKKSTLRVVK